ncbi:MAG: riboflavin biosynthesis protein RibF [Armatimonadetes bacterium]|nr:riboflavin biosynthesis protein RibF [Armatimonadota bacterium]
MRTLFGLGGVSKDWPECTVSIGVFDGVHLGHQEVIGEACLDARENGRPCVVLTFDRHPLALLNPEKCPRALLPLDLRLAKIAGLGVDATVVASFDRPFASQSPVQFFQDVLRGALKAGTVVVGHDFAFGKDRAGDARWLSERIRTIVVEQKEMSGRGVSSTEIRSLVAGGCVSEAAELLGSSYALAGLVVPGRRLGRDLNVPTINLVPIIDQVIPGHGIYAGFAQTPCGRYKAAVSIGVRPTIEGAGFAIEAHLLDFGGANLYGREVVLEVVERLRDEERFSSHEALAEQMRRDIVDARRVLEAANA